jgi:hypothetical protein
MGFYQDQIVPPADQLVDAAEKSHYMSALCQKQTKCNAAKNRYLVTSSTCTRNGWGLAVARLITRLCKSLAIIGSPFAMKAN